MREGIGFCELGGSKGASVEIYIADGEEWMFPPVGGKLPVGASMWRRTLLCPRAKPRTAAAVRPERGSGFQSGAAALCICGGCV